MPKGEKQMKVFTKKDIGLLFRGKHPGYAPKEQREILDGITGANGEFKYAVEPEIQSEIDEMAKDIAIPTKERWKSLEEASKAYAWHASLRHIAGYYGDN